MDIKNEVLYRVYIVLFGLFVPIGLVLVYKTFQISVQEAEHWVSVGEDNYIDEREIEAERGNVMANDGSLLATSVPFFDLYFDPYTASKEEYFNNMDTLAHCLATYVDNSFTVGGFKEYLTDLRDTTVNLNRHVLLKSKVSYYDKRRIEQFPLFNLGRYRSGLIAEKRSERKRPFGLLARRTIGYVRSTAQDVGLEGYYDEALGGKPGTQVMIRVDRKRDLWMPVEDLTEIEPKSGDDILTTIDVNIQDIAERALLKGMQRHDAEWGTAMVMDVKTGEIKGIANLGRIQDKQEWYEIYNYGIGRAVEPGSTFKLASIMALLEDEFVTLEDSVDIEKGETTFYDIVMEDASLSSKKLDTITVRRAFEMSSNVGIAKLVEEHYGTRNDGNNGKGAELFIDKIKQFNLHLPTGIEIEGEANPFVKEAYGDSSQWSGITLPWMSTGYEVKLTPLQLLTFFNAVANDGRLMKPLLVKEIQRFGEQIEIFKPTVVKQEIASRKTIEQVHQLLEGVVKRGTAYKLQSSRYNFAGKTGTAQVGYSRSKRGTRVSGYQASFAGYFPAEAPVYSCIVVIYKPKKGGIYGGDVALPIFREIADKCYDSLIELYDPMNKGPKPVLNERLLPTRSIGDQEDMKKVFAYLNMPFYGEPSTSMVALRAKKDSLIFERRTIKDDVVPNVVGMGLRDALYVMENLGLKVQVDGVGKVVQQSIIPGTRTQGQTVLIKLN
jgi:cell division protein FtsI (penicillin-binding protein 3)